MLGELVDFTDGTKEDIRAAMEASGLLTAEVHPDGAIVLAEGTLLAAPPSCTSDRSTRYPHRFGVTIFLVGFRPPR